MRGTVVKPLRGVAKCGSRGVEVKSMADGPHAAVFHHAITRSVHARLALFQLLVLISPGSADTHGASGAAGTTGRTNHIQLPRGLARAAVGGLSTARENDGPAT